MPAGNSGPGGVRSQSFIDTSLTIRGDLHSDGDVQLDGRVCGNVSCAQLIVGRDAAIAGAVIAEQVIVRGSVTGTIRSPLVILQEPARVDCEITYTVLGIDNGAAFEGVARRCENPLEESETRSPLAELRRIVLAADPASAAKGRDASSASGAGKLDATSEAPAAGDTGVQRRPSVA